MPEDFELETLRKSVDGNFELKQKAYEKYTLIRDRTNEAYNEMQADWKALTKAKEVMDEEYDKIYELSNREVWEEFARFKKKTRTEIEQLKREAESEKKRMERCFNKARSSYEYGDRGESPSFAQKGHEHKERLAEINAEISKKCRSISEARAEAEEKAPRKNNAEFEAARVAYEEAKERHKASRTNFMHFKKEREYFKEKFEDAKAIYNISKNKYLSKANADDLEEYRDQTFTTTSDPKPKKKEGVLHKIFMVIFG